MATSYANTDGTGDRRSSVLASLQGHATVDLRAMLDGSQGDTFFWNAESDTVAEFWFASLRIIDEAIWYQSGASGQGTFKWQGSNDRVTWTDIGSTFTLGSSATQTHTSLNGNATPYRHYRLLQTAGSTNNGPWQREVEFKIEDVGATTYAHVQGTGSRTGSITVSSSGLGFTAAENKLVNGAFAQDLNWDAADISGDWLRWDFGAAVTLQQARWFQSGVQLHGTWQWQGSPDASSWTDVEAPFILGDNSAPTRWPSGGSLDLDVSTMGDLTANLDGYRYWRILGVSGAASIVPWLYEVEFQLVDGGLSGGAIAPIVHHLKQQGLM